MVDVSKEREKKKMINCHAIAKCNMCIHALCEQQNIGSEEEKKKKTLIDKQ